MEGPNLRHSPRTSFHAPIDIHIGGKTIHLDHALGNLSAHGLFLSHEDLPVNSPVHVKIASGPGVEADGVVRFSDAEGVGIEFTAATDADRRRLDDLIAELTRRESLPS